MAKHEVIDQETGEVPSNCTAVAHHAPAAVPAPSQSSDLMSVIAQVAMNPNADVDKLERMLAMKERLDERAREDEERAAQRRFFADLTAAQSAIPVIIKNRKNTFNNTTYADLAAIESAAMPIVRQHGFNVTAKSVPGAEEGMQRVSFRVAHRDGHVDEYEDDFPLDNQGTGGKASKTGIQAKGATVTYARRYMLCGYFNIAISDADGVPQRAQAEPTAPVELTATQGKRLRDLIEQSGADEAQFLTFAKAASIEEIEPSRFAQLEQLLMAKVKKAAADAKKKAAAAEPEAPAVAAE